jgi:hypothetical protein
MPQLTTQKQFRSLQALPFCYLCGKVYVDGDEIDRDHVPPQACFDKKDRNFPLILPTHKACNSAEKDNDEKIGQLIALKFGKAPEQRSARLEFMTAGELVGTSNLDVKGAVWRWIRGFHAALYNEALIQSRPVTIRTPFPSAQQTPNGWVPEPLHAQHQKFVEVIKANRAADNLDRIHCNNGKLLYECVWDQSSAGDWLCVFALNIYEWKDLGDIHRFPARGCAGCYLPSAAFAPETASRARKLAIAVPNLDVLDPFGA